MNGNPLKQPVILQVLPELESGGVERGTIEMAGAIAKRGWGSLVASSGGSMVNKLKYAGAAHITLPLASKNPLVMIFNIFRLASIIREYKVDIIHARSRAPAWSAYFAARRTGAVFITTFHGIYTRGGSWKNKYNSIMTRGERVIAISDFNAQHIIDNYAINPDKITVIPRGVDLNQFDPAQVSPQRVVDIAKAWRLPDHLPVILMPGRITRWKGQNVLVEALADLKTRNFFCIILGNDGGHPAYRQELEQLIMNKGLGENVKLVGTTDDMAAAYMLSHVVVVPSLQPEAFGRVAIEAGAMGRPVIASNHGGTAETVIHGQTGILTTPGSKEELTKALEAALSLTPDEQSQVAFHAMQHVRANYSAANLCTREIELYEELLAKY